MKDTYDKIPAQAFVPTSCKKLVMRSCKLARQWKRLQWKRPKRVPAFTYLPDGPLQTGKAPWEDR